MQKEVKKESYRALVRPKNSPVIRKVSTD